MRFENVKRLFVVTCVALVISGLGEVRADEKGDRVISLAQGKLTMQAPANWVKKKPRTNIVEYEFAAPAEKGDNNSGRITIMGAGGSVEQNIQRWIGQFRQPGGTSSKDKAKIEKREVAGQTVHTVDIAGSFNDRRGPFAPGVMRDNYRMLGAIIETKSSGKYFVKLYGPAKTIAANTDEFKKLVDSLQVKSD